MKKTAILCIVICLAIPCTAATLTVPTPYSTIQSAIDASDPNGDIIIVSPGIYYENINFNGKNIILTSTDPNHPANTIIDANNISSAVTFAGTETSMCQLKGFTITNGTGTWDPYYRSGGGIYGNYTNVEISNCIITGNTADSGSGGGLYECHGAITNCMITGNAAWHGGGLWGCHGAITNCTITGNTSYPYYYDGNGGGLAFCNGTITNCTITGNTADWGYGGGLYNCDGAIVNCIISGNQAFGGCDEEEYCYGGDGGGLYGCGGPITNCTVEGNYADYSGGGLYWCNGAITNCTITGNTAYWYSGGGLYNCDGPITDCMVTSNTTDKHSGGGLAGCDGAITNCTITENTAGGGGGGLDNCDGTITNCKITGNTADYDGGGLIGCDGTITNCTIARNTSYDDGGGLDECDGAITNCIIWENTASNLGNQLYESSVPTYSCIQDWASGGLGNIAENPLFADPNNDFHLKSQAGRWDPNSLSWVTDATTSPCIDAGNPGCPLGNEPNDIANVRINMGAYGGTTEASRTPAGWGLLCDVNNDFSVNTGDLCLFAQHWLDDGECIPADFSRDQGVNWLDFGQMFIEWLDVRQIVEPGLDYQIQECDQGGMAPAAALDGLRFTVTVEGDNILFEDMMTANCCPDELWLEMTVVGNTITIYERELTTIGCFCICDYPVSATFGPFYRGTYTIEVYEDWGGFIGTTTVIID